VFHTDDLQREYDRLAGLGVTFTLPRTKESWGSMATLDDTCGNLIQLTQPAWQCLAPWPNRRRRLSRHTRATTAVSQPAHRES
jgi:hypothetical protein